MTTRERWGGILKSELPKWLTLVCSFCGVLLYIGSWVQHTNDSIDALKEQQIITGRKIDDLSQKFDRLAPPTVVVPHSSANYYTEPNLSKAVKPQPVFNSFDMDTALAK